MTEIEKYRKDKTRAKNKGNIKEAAKICNILGELLSKEGRYEEAIEEHQDELFLSEAVSDWMGAAVANRKIGECHCNLKQYKKALKHLHKFLQVAQAGRDDVETQRAFAALGQTYLEQVWNESAREVLVVREALKKAKAAFQNSLEFSEKLKGKISVKEHAEMKARLLLNLGLVYEQKADIKKCIDLIKQAITLSEIHVLKEDVYRCQVSLAGIYHKQGSYSQALRLFDSAYKYAVATRDRGAETDILVQKMLLYLQLGDFFAAQRTIKKAYKMNSTNINQKERLGEIFKAVILMDKINNELNSIPEQEVDQRMVVYEKLGDAAASAQIGNYKQAIKCYQNMLKCALMLGKSGSDLTPVYVSLAQTYKDDKQYTLGVEYFHKELECRAGDPKQMCLTWINIAEAEELGGETYSQVMDSYKSAFEVAKAAGLHKLQADVLGFISVSQGNFKREEAREETLQELRVLKETYSVDSEEVSDTEEESSQDAVPVDEIDLDEYMSDSDASENEEYDRSKIACGRGVARRKTKTQVKRNEKGETPLHRACIDGDSKKVKALLAQDHPVNTRDFCGWIPLHEAANLDYVEIVEMLLDAGAWINDRGGQQCEGITPLHDACSCGNINVIQLLVSRGANVHAKDNNGNTVLDSLMEYMHRSGGGLTRQIMDILKSTEKLIRDTMRGNNPHLSNNLTQYQNTSPPTQEPMDDNEDLPSFPPRRTRRRSPEPRWTTSTQIITSGRQTPDSNMDGDNLEESVIREYEERQDASTRQDTPSSQSQEVRDSTPQGRKRSRSMVKEEDDSDDEPQHSYAPSHPDLNLPSLDDASAARGVYQNTMASLRRSAVSTVPLRPVRMSQTTSRSGPALVNNESYIGDDWLIDDMGVNAKPAKRNRVDADGLITTTGTRRSGEGGKKRQSWEEKGTSREEIMDSTINESSKRRSAERYRTDERITNLPSENREEDYMSDTDSLIEAFGDDDINFVEETDYYFNEPTQAHFPSTSQAVTSSQQSVSAQATTQRSVSVNAPSQTSRSRLTTKKPRQTTLTNFGLTSQPVYSSLIPSQTISGMSKCTSFSNNQTSGISQASAPLVKPVMRLKVKIKDRCILVPVPSADRTISWLSEEAAQRYYKLYNMRPLLSIATRDGAVLSPEDPVSFVLADNEEVEGQVQSWDLPPLPDRYTDACTMQKAVMYRNVKTLMTTAMTTQKLELVNIALRPVQFTPVCKALQCQYLLKELHLNGNRIGNDGFASLCEVLSTLPSLTTLNLASNQITDSALQTLATSLQKQSTEIPLKALEKLDLSFNPLGDGTTQSLAVIVRHLPALRSLSLVACEITMRFFQEHRITLAEALQGSNLLHLDLSHNLLGSTGVELLLRCLRHQVLRSLSLGGVLPSYTSNHFHKHLYSYLMQPDCALSKLVLDNCYLLPELWPEITGFISKSKTLEQFCLSSNTKITNADMVEVLEAAAQSESSRLEAVVFNGCNLQGPLSINFVDAINDKLSHTHPLKHVAFTCSSLTQIDKDTLRDIWASRWSDDSKCSFDNAKVVLSTVDFDRL